ncbi:MAG: discoidin domain-containing protein, partial [Candidatus Acidiferrales bacterium]
MRRRKFLMGLMNFAAATRASAASLLGLGSVSQSVSARRPGRTNPDASIASPDVIEIPRLNTPPNFADYASIEAESSGQPVYGLDYMMYIYGVGPDLMPGVVLQTGNNHPRVKIRPKKSWEIKHNLLGSNTAQVPRTRTNDSHPTLPIHLIDGDPNTVWCSFGSLAPDVHPEWIRIDLPIEANVTSVKLVCTNSFYPNSNFGRALPKELTVKLSTDAWHWETVFANDNIDVKAEDGVEIKFASRRAKQIWITANNFLTRIRTPSSAGPITFFSIAGVEVRDTNRENLALVSRGAGVTVSSTYFGHADNRLTQAELWAPLHYDMGMTWLRIAGAEAGAYDWAYIEHQPGRFQFDSVLDEWLTDLHRCGVKLIWGLDIYGNPIYGNPPRNLDWPETRLRKFTDGTLSETMSLDADSSPEMFAAYLRHVEYVVRHLKGRVYVYEVGNEFTGCGWDDEIAERYINIFEKTYEAVKKIDPDARIMPASPDLFAPDFLLTLLGQPRTAGVRKGKLVANGGSLKALDSSTLLLAGRVKTRNAEVSVNALNRGRFGIVLRYTSPESFVVAGYGTCWPGAGRYPIVIAEHVGNSWEKSRMSSKKLDADLNQNVRLKARVEDGTVKLEVSDGNRVESLTHELVDRSFDGAGSVGLLQLTGAHQEFVNFS